MGRGLVAGVGVTAGFEEGVSGAESVPSEALGPAFSELGSGGRPSTPGDSCSSQEVPLRALSVERRPRAHLLLPRVLPRPVGSPIWGPGKWTGEALGSERPGKANELRGPQACSQPPG